MSIPSSSSPDLAIAITRDLIRIPTVNPPGNELPAAQYLADVMESLGLDVTIQEIEPNRANVIGRLKGRRNGHLVLSGHIDVVPPGEQPWERNPFSADMDDTYIYGRGSTDMKSGVGAIVAALGRLKAEGFQPEADVIAAISYGEEAGLVGAEGIVERRALEGAHYLLVAEPTDLDVYIAEKGTCWTIARFLGRTAHGARPDLGANAVSAMARLIPRLEANPFPYTESPLLGHPTVSVNVIRGGNKTNVVPDLCEIEVDMRTVPGQDLTEIVASMERMGNEIAREYGPHMRFEVEPLHQMLAVETSPDHHLVGAAIAAVRAVTGRTPKIGGVPYATDAACLGPGFAIPMVICGPGDTSMLHQPDERVLIRELVEATDIYCDLAQRLLSGGA